ncbi:MAG: NAD(P)H-dependent oxidoreductase [Kofleriaceae bacterium]
MTIAVLVGSLRKESITRKIARAIEPFMPGLQFEHIEIGQLPLYNQDLDDATPPAEWTAFRERMRAATGYLFVTPEYNRTIPGALKNALDVGSRPGGKSAFAGAKPGAVVSVSPFMLGGFGANHHLRQALVFLDIAVLQQPEMYVNKALELLDDQGAVRDEGAKKLFARFGAAFTAWVARLG